MPSLLVSYQSCLSVGSRGQVPCLLWRFDCGSLVPFVPVSLVFSHNLKRLPVWENNHCPSFSMSLDVVTGLINCYQIDAKWP